MVYGIPSHVVNLLATGNNSFMLVMSDQLALWSEKFQVATKKLFSSLYVCLATYV